VPNIAISLLWTRMHAITSSPINAANHHPPSIINTSKSIILEGGPLPGAKKGNEKSHGTATPYGNPQRPRREPSAKKHTRTKTQTRTLPNTQKKKKKKRTLICDLFPNSSSQRTNKRNLKTKLMANHLLPLLS
jgi:hypothetical protein